MTEFGRVEMWRGGSRPGLSVAAPFVWRCLSNLAVTPFPHPAHRTGRAVLPHPAFGPGLTLQAFGRLCHFVQLRRSHTREGLRLLSQYPAGVIRVDQREERIAFHRRPESNEPIVCVITAWQARLERTCSHSIGPSQKHRKTTAGSVAGIDPQVSPLFDQWSKFDCLPSEPNLGDCGRKTYSRGRVILNTQKQVQLTDDRAAWRRMSLSTFEPKFFGGFDC